MTIAPTVTTHTTLTLTTTPATTMTTTPTTTMITTPTTAITMITTPTTATTLTTTATTTSTTLKAESDSNLPLSLLELLGPIELPPIPKVPTTDTFVLPPELQGYSSPVISPSLTSPIQSILGSVYGINEVFDENLEFSEILFKEKH